MKAEISSLADVFLNIIPENSTLKQALEQLDKVVVKVLFVVRGEGLVAALTDGDVRRAILAGGSLETQILKIANYCPVYLEHDDETLAKKYLDDKIISAVPVVAQDKKIVKIYTNALINIQNEIKKLDIPVVLMAGGLGTRLYPYTAILPKPLIPVADIPISERIIKSFRAIGCWEFHMIVNYKKNMIKAYFNDIDCDYNVTFWDEDVPLGTGGGIRLLRNEIKKTFVMTNCDILIMDDVRKILDHHKEKGNAVTMVCSLKNFEIPYGIVNFSEGGEISSFEEKPQMSFFTNTGYYILEPDVFKYIKEDECISMPDIIDRMRNEGQRVGIYPISENAWLDMGQFDTMESMERRLKELSKEGLIENE